MYTVCGGYFAGVQAKYVYWEMGSPIMISPSQITLFTTTVGDISLC